eukprot:6150159-Prymnesium_polylepis.2
MTKEQADDAAAGIDVLSVGDNKRSRYVKKISAKMIQVAIRRSADRSSRSFRNHGSPGTPRSPRTPCSLRSPRKSSSKLRPPNVDSVSVASSTTEPAPSSSTPTSSTTILFVWKHVAARRLQPIAHLATP